MCGDVFVHGRIRDNSEIRLTGGSGAPGRRKADTSEERDDAGSAGAGHSGGERCRLLPGGFSDKL